MFKKCQDWAISSEVTRMIKEVEDFQGYKVSSDGYVIGKRKSRLKGKITWDGYEEVILSDGKRRRSVRSHTLITEAFFGEKPEGYVVNHKDGDKLNNALSNLEYVTVGDNTRHAFATGLAKCKGRPVSSLTKEEFNLMRTMRDAGSQYKDICKALDLKCRPDYLGEILSGRKCSQVSGF